MIRLVRCFMCGKRFFLRKEQWKYDKYMEIYPNGTACIKCSKEGDVKK